MHTTPCAPTLLHVRVQGVYLGLESSSNGFKDFLALWTREREAEP